MCHFRHRCWQKQGPRSILSSSTVSQARSQRGASTGRLPPSQLAWLSSLAPPITFEYAFDPKWHFGGLDLPIEGG
jgi:hypothetical protein